VGQIPAPATVTATDSCGTALLVSYSQYPATLTSSCSNVITRTWSATDCAGQTVAGSQVITQLDNVIPTANQGSISNCYTSLAAADAAALAATTTGTVGCGGSNLSFTVSDNGQTCPATITVTGTDGCSNSTTVTYTATILTNLPTMSGVPANTTVQCVGQIPAPATVTATDSCGTALLVSYSQYPATLTSSCSNVITRTWSATDCAGQTVTSSQVITQLDNVIPTANQGSISNCYTSLAAADAAALAATTTGTVGCGGSNLTFKVTNNGQTCPATITVTGTDGCGNSTTVTYTATILTALPTLHGVPANTTVQCVGQIPAPATVTATDSCGTALLVSYSQYPATLTSSCSNVITRTWSATDCAGQIVTSSQVITQLDNVIPTANKGSISNCYTSLAAADAAALAATTTGTVGCGGSNLTFKVTNNGQTCPATITVTGTDGCGNSTTVTYTATILTNPPALHGVPAGTTVQCAGEIPAAPAVTATDSCGTSLLVTTNQTESNPTSTCSNVITRTWSATDCAGQTATGTQVITQYNSVGPIITCPSNVVISTNVCKLFCTFTPCDWNSQCIGFNNTGCNNNNWNWTWKAGWTNYQTNWWTTWCKNNPPTNCWPSWSNWWTACNGTNPGANWWESWTNTGNGNHWSGCWTAKTGNWWNTWANNNTCNNQSWVPCAGNNPGDILTNCFATVYGNGCVQIGLPGSGYCLTFTSPAAVRNCLNFSGAPGVFNCSATNPTSCNAGSFCSQVLALELNCNFGDCTNGAPSFFGRCGDAVLTDSTSPCDGLTVRGILALCNTALGCGSLPPGCTLSNLCCLASNLNQCFEGCQPSGWCCTHLAPVYIPPPSQTGTATVTDACSPSPTPTYSDTVSTNEGCQGNYVISRTWLAVDACGHSNTCIQTITIEQGSSSGVSGKVVLACSGETNVSNNEGLANVTVTLETASDTTVATTTTSANGNYAFASVPAGTYTVEVTPPAGYSQTSPSGNSNSQTVTLSGCQTLTGVNFGYTGSTPAVSICKTGPKCISHGQTATYCFAVTNTGNTCLTLQVNDPLLGGVIFSESAVPPGQGYVFSSTYLVKQTNGTLTNTAWAIGTPPSGGAVSNQASTMATITTKCVTNTICGNFNSQNPGNGWLWCNAHISGTPGKKVTVFCQNASVTLSCTDGKTYTFPIPNGQINFSPTCTVGTNWFDGTQWNTTLPCAGDDQIFLQGCAIPWQSDFANCQSVCWTGIFSCDTSGFSCNWQWGAACYNNSQPACGSICPKACHKTSCPNGEYYNSSDNAGCPENTKPYCVGGATGGGGSNCTGSWSSTGTCSF
jgi:hypothetical protein